MTVRLVRGGEHAPAPPSWILHWTHRSRWKSQPVGRIAPQCFRVHSQSRNLLSDPNRLFFTVRYTGRQSGRLTNSRWRDRYETWRCAVDVERLPSDCRCSIIRQTTRTSRWLPTAWPCRTSTNRCLPI